MSVAENVRSFWAAKDRIDTTDDSPRLKESRTMEGLRSTLQVQNMTTKERIRSLPARPIDLPSKVVQNSVFLERDRTPSPGSSPTFTRKSPFSKESLAHKAICETPPNMPSQDSPHRSALASPEPGARGLLSRSKSVTFNESPEVRHMSDCSFDEASSPYSANYGTDEDENEDADADEDDEDEATGDRCENVEYTTDTLSLDEMTRRNTNMAKMSTSDRDSPFALSSRALPIIPGARPLPIVPCQPAESVEARVLATKQEDSRKQVSGLGLHLPQDATEDFSSRTQDLTVYDADKTNIRRDVQQFEISETASETFPAMSRTQADLNLSEARRLGSPTGVNQDAKYTAEPEVYTPSRSPEPAISRQYVKEKLAQRKAAQDDARNHKTSAFKPHVSLAPPLPHYDSFLKLDKSTVSEVLTTDTPESPMSDAAYPEQIVPQRKVSDTHRPVTPIEQVIETAQDPPSGRALHHEREKRRSVDISQDKPVPSPVAAFTAINYDGDDYDSDVEGMDDLIIHPDNTHELSSHDIVSDTIHSSIPNAQDKDVHKEALHSPHENDSPLQLLPQIPDLPVGNAVSTPQASPRLSAFDMRHMSLSLDFDSTGSDSLGLEQYMTPERRPETPITSRTVVSESPSKTDGNVSILDSWENNTEGHIKEDSTTAESATITARGVKLRTRPSMTPADTAVLAARRRQVSLEIEPQEGVQVGKVKSQCIVASSVPLENSPRVEAHEGQIESPEDENSDVVARIQPMAMPVLQPLTRELSFSDINSAFDRVMQKQKKGYVIRHQSRVVHATAHHKEPETSAEDLAKGHTRQSSSVYTTMSQFSGKSHERYKDQSAKIPHGVQMSPRPRSVMGTLAPIVVADNIDGGRLFIRVMHVKHLTLPIPKGEESFFCCTLDNGKHCVTTPWHTLANNIKINQEFELIANHDLEFILTLQAQYSPPKVPARPKSTLGRLLNSPKRHKPTGSITSLSLAGYVGDDGSFARAHLALKHFRNKAFGRPYTMVVPVLNEWAVETTGVASRNGPVVRQRKPYKIAEIELQVLYVPPVEEDQRYALPTSLSQAVRDLREAEWHHTLHCEGFLSQQGGDCPYWRRRQFKLVGSKLTAYHANTGQVRATINLAKAIQVSDDRESLTATEVTIGKGEHQTRRKSGFAEREEGHLYVAEGFRIRFANGEVIDFYADSHAEKEKWILVLKNMVQKVPVTKAWCQTVLEAEAARATSSVAI